MVDLCRMVWVGGSDSWYTRSLEYSSLICTQNTFFAMYILRICYTVNVRIYVTYGIAKIAGGKKCAKAGYIVFVLQE